MAFDQRTFLATVFALALAGCGSSGGDGAPSTAPDGTDVPAQDNPAMSPSATNPKTPPPTSSPEAPASDPLPDDSPDTTPTTEPVPPIESETPPADPDETAAPDTPSSDPPDVVESAPDENAGDVSASDGRCDGTLPCRWMSEDGGVIVLVTAADGENSNGTGDLRIDFSIETTRETEISIDRESFAQAGGDRFSTDTLSFGTENGSRAASVASRLFVDTPQNASIAFGEPVLSGNDVVERFNLLLRDEGTPVTATFEDLPFGREPSANATCGDALPCAWTSADGQVTVTLTSANGQRYNFRDRLVVDFTVESERRVSVGAGGASLATSDQGDNFEGDLMEVGDQSTGSGRLVYSLIANDFIGGRLSFGRLPTDLETSLRRLELDLFETRRPRVPRWTPVFEDVPIAPR